LEVLLAVQRDGRALRALLHRLLLQVARDAARGALPGGGRGRIGPVVKQAGGRGQVALAVDQVGVAVAVAGDRRGQGLLNDAALAVVLGVGVPLLAAGGVLVGPEHDLGVGVAVDRVRIAVGQRLHGLGGPAVVAGGVRAG